VTTMGARRTLRGVRGPCAPRLEAGRGRGGWIGCSASPTYTPQTRCHVNLSDAGMPADGAVSGLRVLHRKAEHRRPEVDKKERGAMRFEQALPRPARRHSRGGALQAVHAGTGQLPPQTEVMAELPCDQGLSRLSEGACGMAFPTAAGGAALSGRGGARRRLGCR